MALNGSRIMKNGLKSLYAFPINEDGTYGERFKVAGMTEFSLSIEEVENTIYEGNGVYLSEKKKSKATGTFGCYDLSDEVVAKLYGTSVNANGDIIVSQDDNTPYIALGVEFTGKNPNTGLETTGTYILAKVALGQMSESLATQGDSITYNTKSISYTLIPLDNKCIYLKHEGECPETLELELFNKTV